MQQILVPNKCEQNTLFEKNMNDKVKVFHYYQQYLNGQNHNLPKLMLFLGDKNGYFLTVSWPSLYS